MSKFIVFIIIGIVVFGLFFYFKPDKTKETFKGTTDTIGSLIKDYWENQEKNLGRPNLPCQNDLDCNENIPDCSNNCTCISGDCIKNIKINST